MTTQNPSSSLKTINGRQHLVGLGVTVLVFIAAGIGIWQAGERGDRAIAPVAVETSDRTTAAELPRSSAVDDGRLTVYLAGPSADEISAAYARTDEQQRFWTDEQVSRLQASVMVIGSTDDERRFDEWLTAVRVGLGVPVDVFDLRTPA